MVHFDYTFRIADALLHGKLGMTETPPDWLNEMVPFEARYYSVFPLGSVLSLLPLAVLKLVGVIDSFPAAFVAASIAAAAATFRRSPRKTRSNTVCSRFIPFPQTHVQCFGKVCEWLMNDPT